MEKLLKYDLKATARLLLPLFLFDIIYLIMLGFIVHSGFQLHNEWNGIILGIIGFAAFFITCFMPAIVLLMRYYQTLYGDLSTLTYSLPLGSGEKLNSKIILSVIWTIINTFVLLLFAIVLIFCFAATEESFSPIKDQIGHLASVTADFIHLSFPLLVVFFVALILLALFYIVSQTLYSFFLLSLAARFFSAKTIVLGFVVLLIFWQIIGFAISYPLITIFPYAIAVDFSGAHLAIKWFETLDAGYQQFQFTTGYGAADVDNMIYFPLASIAFWLILTPILYGLTRLMISKRPDIS